ncbi:MAG: PorV/PorQ family protein [Bacteroidota bacterium]
MRIRIRGILLIVSLLAAGTLQAQQKLAQTGMKFLSVGSDARAVALGEAMTAIEFGSAAMMYNPAGMARVADRADIRLSNLQYIADIQHYVGNIAISPAKGEYGVLGFFVQYVDYGMFEGTIRSDNAQGYLDMGAFYPSAMVIGASYARALTDKFSVGGNAKYVEQTLGPSVNELDANGYAIFSKNSAHVWAFDFGLLYRTGFKSLNFGMVVRNFSQEVTFQEEGFQLPLNFKIGVSMNIWDFVEQENADHALLLAFDAEHPRDYVETVRFGIEYRMMDFLALRVGRVSPQSEYSWSYGIGLRKQADEATMGIGFDYAYTPFGLFGDVHRFTLQIAL